MHIISNTGDYQHSMLFYSKENFWTFAKINQRKHIFSPSSICYWNVRYLVHSYEFTSGETISWQSEQSSFLLRAMYAWCQTKYCNYFEVCHCKCAVLFLKPHGILYIDSDIQYQFQTLNGICKNAIIYDLSYVVLLDMSLNDTISHYVDNKLL